MPADVGVRDMGAAVLDPHRAGPRVHTAAMATGTEVKIVTERGSMPTYCAVPTTSPPWPGVVVVHDFTG